MAVFENFPYTNVHELNLNWIVKNMKQLLEDWDAFTTNVDATAQSGSSAGVEVIGSLKEGLTFKFTLPKGDRGDTGEAGNGIDTVLFNPNYSLTFNFTNGTSYTTPSLRGAQGEGLKINDTYPTIEALEQAHPTGVEGDAYLIGTDPNFTLYIWSTRLNDYAMVGALTSPQPTETTPLMDGVASTGDEYAYARGDHRHPSDTSKVDVTTFNQSVQDIIDDINTINSDIQNINGNITNLQNTKQNHLTAGAGIDLVGDTISSKINMDLLWTNSSSSSSFAGQNITIPNKADYKAFIVVLKESTTTVHMNNFIVLNGTRTLAQSIWYGEYANKYYLRPINAQTNSTDIIIGDCTIYSDLTSSTTTTNNNVAIPLSIYGIK